MAHGAGKRPTILVSVAEDQERATVGRVLERAGYQVLSARGEEEGASALREGRCALVLLALDKGSRGFAGLRRLRAVYGGPVVAIASDPLQAERALAEGCALCLDQPLDLDRLPWRIGSVLNDRRRSLGTEDPTRACA